MSTGPAVAKTVWTDADFDTMSWHDNAVHAVALEPAQAHPGRLLLDIDYILEGILPEAPATTLSFWICPATLVFDRAWDLTTDINLQGWSFQLFLDAIERAGPDERGFFEWTLAGDHFSIGLSAPGFTQYLRHAPIRSPGYWLSVDEREDSASTRRATPAEGRNPRALNPLPSGMTTPGARQPAAPVKAHGWAIWPLASRLSVSRATARVRRSVAGTGSRSCYIT